MKPTPADAEPRPDGWFPHQAWWSEVTIGTVIAGRKPGERWAIIDARQQGHGLMGETPWFRAREMTSGAEYTMPPRPTKDPVVILTRSPTDTWAGRHKPPSDADAIMLLVEQLGATVLASRDDKTGEVTCPDYVYDTHPGTGLIEGFVEHMRIAHALQVDDDIEPGDAYRLHAQAHSRNHPDIGKGGFAHRHKATHVY